MVIALKTRTAPAADAVAQSIACVRWLQQHAVERVYFKYCSTFDSTPDGNIGPVADALLDALGEQTTLDLPGLPRARPHHLPGPPVRPRRPAQRVVHAPPPPHADDRLADPPRPGLQTDGEVGLLPLPVVRERRGRGPAAEWLPLGAPPRRRGRRRGRGPPHRRRGRHGPAAAHRRRRASPAHWATCSRAGSSYRAATYRAARRTRRRLGRFLLGRDPRADRRGSRRDAVATGSTPSPPPTPTRCTRQPARGCGTTCTRAGYCSTPRHLPTPAPRRVAAMGPDTAEHLERTLGAWLARPSSMVRTGSSSPAARPPEPSSRHWASTRS